MNWKLNPFVWGMLLLTTTACLDGGLSRLNAQEKVYPKQGPVANGKIVSNTQEEVVIEVRGANQKFPAIEIARLALEGEPTGYSRAKDLVAQEQFDQAKDELKKIDPAGLKTDDVKKEWEFYTAFVDAKLALIGQGDAIKSSQSLLKAVQNKGCPYRFYDAAQLLAELAMIMGNDDAASKYLGGIGKSNFPAVKANGKYLEAKLDLKRKKIAEARKAILEINALSATDTSVTRIQRLARVLQARVDTSDGKSQDAIQVLGKLIKDNDSADHELFASIYNAQGEAFLAAGQPEQAALAYLHNDLLFFDQPEAHAESLFYLTQIWPKLGEPQRGTEARSKLSNMYPSSLWAKK